jgi:glycosyltransferase involved in cell wall biosynthesis
MRTGSLVYAVDRGLGHLAKAFYDHGIVTNVMIIEHASIRPTRTEWYPEGTPVIPIRRLSEGREAIQNFLKGLDIFLAFETPYLWDNFDFCREHHVTSVLEVMLECTPEMHSQPDYYLCPSLWELDYFMKKRLKGAYLPVPIDTRLTPWRKREVAHHFVHNGGYLGLRGREGTAILAEALKYVKSPAIFTVRVQERPTDSVEELFKHDPRVTYIHGNTPYAELFAGGDVYVAPQKFNGLSLPLQEAHASGMAVLTTDRFPMNKWLPPRPLVKPRTTVPGVKVGGPYIPFEESLVHPEDLAAKIDELYGTDITVLSDLGRKFAERTSWEQLKPEYLALLEGLRK